MDWLFYFMGVALVFMLSASICAIYEQWIGVVIFTLALHIALTMMIVVAIRNIP